MRKILVLIIISFLAFSCVSGPSPNKNSIDRIIKNWADGLENKDIEQLMGTYWPEAVFTFIPPDGENMVLNGTDAIRAGQESGFVDRPNIDINLDASEVQKTDNKITYILVVEFPDVDLINILEMEKRNNDWRIINQTVQIQNEISLGNEKIYFVGRPYSENPEALIYSVNFDGTGLTPISNLKGWRPRISSNGKKLLWSPDDNIISVYDFDSGETKVILEEEAFNWDPVWSPDGSRIAFASRRTGMFDIWSMKNDGTDLKNLTNTPDVGEWDPRWNSNGKIYFGRNMVNDVGWERVPEIFSEQIQLFSMDSEGENETQLTEGDGWNANYSFSYDEKWILNGQDEWVYTMDLDGGNRKNLLNFDDSGFNQFMGHVLSKDMNYIVLSGLKQGDEHFYLYTYNIESGEYKRITDQDYMEEWFPEF